MIEPASGILKETVNDWLLNGPENAELIFLSSTLNKDVLPDTSVWPPVSVWRSVAVFCVAHQVKDYVVMLDDGDNKGIRSWTVDEDAVLPEFRGAGYVIPGPELGDDVFIPYNPFEVIGGLGTAAAESHDVVGYSLRVKLGAGNV